MTSGEQTAGMVAFSDISLGTIVHSQPRAILSASLRVLGRHDAFLLVGCTSHCSVYGSRSLLASAPWALRARVQGVRTGCKGLLGVDTSVLTVRPALEANFWLEKIGLELCVHFKISESASASIVKLVGCCMYVYMKAGSFF